MILNEGGNESRSKDDTKAESEDLRPNPKRQGPTGRRQKTCIPGPGRIWI